MKWGLVVFTPPKNQIPSDWLALKATLVHERLKPWLAAYDKRKISAAELVAVYILIFLILWKEKKFLNGKCAGADQPILNSALTLGELNLDNIPPAVRDLPVIAIFRSYRLRGIMERAQRALVKWHDGDYPIELFFYAPSARDLLAIQATGRRVVTLFVGLNEMSQKQMDRDPMTFALHDLEHADEFFSDKNLFLAQQEFYRDIQSKLDSGFYDDALKCENFRRDFEYVIADMNSHPEHLKATLEFIWRDYLHRNATTHRRTKMPQMQGGFKN